MPTVPAQKVKGGAYQPFLEPDSIVADQDINPRVSRKKAKNAASRQSQLVGHVEDTPAEEVTRDRSPTRPQSILGQIPHSFGRNNASLDVIDALGRTEKVSDQYTSHTDEWAQSIPYGKSPPVDNLAGTSTVGSPPVPGPIGRGGFSARSPPVSPHLRKSRPLSYGSSIPPLPARPAPSEHSHRYQQSAYGSPPIPPHLPQPHFYGVGDVDLGLGRGKLAADSDEVSFVGFSPAPLLHLDFPKRGRQAVLLGTEGRLDVLISGGNKMDPLGCLQGLPGTIIGANFLTWESGPDPFVKYRPLIAVILHGPKVVDDGDQGGTASDDESIHSMVTAGMQTNFPQNATQPLEYQTRVEVYSLARKCHITTLLKTPPVAAEMTFRNQLPRIPSPIGALKLDAAGNFIAISSGLSGEVFVFTPSTSTSHPRFACLGKFWTCIQAQTQRRDSSHGRSPDSDISPADLNRGLGSSEAPILSLSSRWLAICPAASPSRPSLSAIIGTSVSVPKSMLRDLQTAPSRPAITSEVESPDVDTLFSKVARGVAQEVVRGAKWLSDQSLQTWNSYWKKEQPPSPTIRNGYGQPYSPQPPPSQFPPTHSLDTQTNSREPELVSIYDLKMLQNVHAKKADSPKPLATFQPPAGCSFLSFMPNGLGLLTAGKKGDVQYIWDLMQLKHCRSAILAGDGPLTDGNVVSPRVRQIAKFARLTSSTVVDVVWESAVGDRLALVTRNGTVHLFDLPSNAFRWPPPRRAKKPRPMSAPVDPNALLTTAEPIPTSGFFSQAMNIAGRTQPILATLRGRAPSLGAGLSGIGSSGIGIASATGVKGGRAVATGISRSLGAASGTVSNIRHAGESRLHLKSLASDPSAGKVAWDLQGSTALLIVLDKTAYRSYYVTRSQAREASSYKRTSVVDSRKAAGLKLPTISALNRWIGANQDLAGAEFVDDVARPVPGWWKIRMPPPAEVSSMSHPLSHAEIETNPPYQPFHSDRRVNLFIYPEGREMTDSQLPTASMLFGAPDVPAPWSSSPDRWVFGNDIPGVQLNIHASQGANDESGSIIYRQTTASPTDEANADGIAEQIVSTTRRRKNIKAPEASAVRSGEGVDEEGFFEDDCDVVDFAVDRV